jgi:uncharacterized protein (TIGR02996 family)
MHQAFLQTIRESPDDDTPRLVYADWLEEHGDADRAEFIRLQIERSRLPGADPADRPLRNRAVALLARHVQGWLGPLADWLHVSVKADTLVDQERNGDEVYRLGLDGRAVFRRGFVDQVVLSGTTFAHADAVFGLQPVRCLTLSAAGDCLPDLAAAPWAARLRELIVLWDNNLGAASFTLLVTSPHLAGLTHLSLCGNPVGPAGVQALAACPHLANLRRLRLSSCGLDAGAVEVLAACPHLAGAAVLHLDSNAIGDAGARTLARGPAPAAPETLYLQECGIGAAGARALAGSPRMVSLRRLLLHGRNPIGPAGVEALAASPHLTGLRELYLEPGAWSLGAARALAGSPALGSLEVLSLEGRVPRAIRRLLHDRFGHRLHFEM